MQLIRLQFVLIQLEIPFPAHENSCQTVQTGNVSQTNENETEIIDSNIFCKLSPAEGNHMANGLKTLDNGRFLKRFRCHLEVSLFEIIADKQVLKYFLTKPKMRRRGG